MSEDDGAYLAILISGLLALTVFPWWTAFFWAIAASVWMVRIESNSRKDSQR